MMDSIPRMKETHTGSIMGPDDKHLKELKDKMILRADQSDIIAPEEKGYLKLVKEELFLRALIVAAIYQLTPNIPTKISRIAQLSFATEDEVRLQLKKLKGINPEYGEYLEDEDVFVRRIDTEGEIDPLISTEHYLSESVEGKIHQCLECGNFQSVRERVCENCLNELDYCSICNRGYALGDQVSICPHCAEMFHKDQVIAYIEQHSECPDCKTYLDTSMII